MTPEDLLAALDTARAAMGADPEADAEELAEAAERLGLDVNPDANAARAQAADQALAAVVAVAQAADGKLPPPWAVLTEGAAMERGRLVATVVVRHGEDMLALDRIALVDDKARARLLRRAVATARDLGVPDVPGVALRLALLRLPDEVRPEAPGGAATTQSALLVALAQDAELFHDPEGEAYATVAVGGHRETRRVRGRGFRTWLVRGYYAQAGKPARCSWTWAMPHGK